MGGYRSFMGDMRDFAEMSKVANVMIRAENELGGGGNNMPLPGTSSADQGTTPNNLQRLESCVDKLT
eukprot:5838811-Karenia_brevis.AAC.1